MTNRSPQDKWLGDIGHLDCRLQTSDDTDLFQSTLERHAIDHRRQHSHIVGGRPIHPAMTGREPSPNITTPDDNRDFDAKIADLQNLFRDIGHYQRRDGLMAPGLTKRFTAQLEYDPSIFWLTGCRFKIGHEKFTTP